LKVIAHYFSPSLSLKNDQLQSQARAICHQRENYVVH